MINFKIIKKSEKSSARIGILTTPHGEVETPAFVPVATQAVIKTLDSREVKETGSQLLIANTYHLTIRPGEDIVADNGGLHGFMQWDRPFMTDSGGFQVFSLGFGKDLQVGKILKYFPGENDEVIHKNSAPKFLKITEDGVLFRSYTNGSELFLGPKESIQIQEKLGADIILAFDECTPPLSKREYVEGAIERTRNWAKICVATKNSDQALYGIVQGSRFQDLREEHAKFTNALGFDGFAIGGDLGESKKTLEQILHWITPHLEENKPRHLLGVGHLEDMELMMRNGMDTFDCIAPTHYARRGTAFTSEGKINLRRTPFLKDKEPVDKTCLCYVCQTYRRSYLSHLIRAGEITGLKLLTFHNLFFFNTYVAQLRQKIKDGKL